MPNFQYKAIDANGKQARGRMDALNDIDLELRLKHMGLDLITFHVANLASGFGSKRVGLQDLVMFCFQMEQMTRAGVPLLDGLIDLRDSTSHPTLREAIGTLVSSVEGGKQFSQALAEHTNIFNHVFVSLVRAGEQTGKLPDVFENLASTLRWQDELISQTKRLLAYPLFVLFVVLGAVVFLMTYLVPQMASFLQNMGQELPLQTKILIGTSKIFVDDWWLILGLPIILAILIALMIKQNPSARYRWDHFKLHIPIIGEILNKIIMARFARYFALMYQTGIPILDAIKTCQQIVGNTVVADALERVWQQINAGDNMSESFRNAGLFPPLVVRMIRVGEASGSLDKALLNIADFYDREVKEKTETLLNLLEPALTVILGGILAFIMFSVLGPVYDSFSKLKL